MSRIRLMIQETGQTGFHFVDEAAPPKVLFALARRIIDEGADHYLVGQCTIRKELYAQNGPAAC